MRSIGRAGPLISRHLARHSRALAGARRDVIWEAEGRRSVELLGRGAGRDARA